MGTRERIGSNQDREAQGRSAAIQDRLNIELRKLLTRLRKEMDNSGLSICGERGQPVIVGEVQFEEETYQLIGMRLHPARRRITQREKEVATLARRGLTDKGIALQLGISIHTVITHLRRIYNKLGISSRVSLSHYPFGTSCSISERSRDADECAPRHTGFRFCRLSADIKANGGPSCNQKADRETRDSRVPNRSRIWVCG